MSNYQMNDCSPRTAPVCAQSKRAGSCCGLCSTKVIGFFVVALAAALGLIFGAVYAEQIVGALAAVIVFAAVMLIAIIALVIYRLCEGC